MEATVAQVLEALSVMLSVQQQPVQARRQANKWLEQFQKQQVAWGICDQIIQDQSSPQEVRLFAAQTFRQKVEFDLDQLDIKSIQSLRNSLLELLFRFRSGPKALLTQLSISLADLAVQMTDWHDPVGYMIDQFQTSEMQLVLLEFLSVLPEELLYNRKIGVDRSLVKLKEDQMLKPNAQKVMNLLGSLLNGNPDTTEKILRCLESWLRANSLTLDLVLPMAPFIFEQMNDPSLFEVCVDIVCELIVQSSEPRNDQAIQTLYHLMMPLCLQVKDTDDPEIVRGICRILVEAGEHYSDIVFTNYDAFSALIEGVLVCCAYEDLDIARITFNVWYKYADLVVSSQDQQLKQPFYPVFSRLVESMIKHLHYPTDMDNWKAQDRDEFREFRHVMGDVLKDCVRVLGVDALSIPFNMLSQCFNGQHQWQDIEAPLFSLRAMCREIPETESKYVPQIMQMLPQLPSHPKIRYAAILVIGRYAEWTNKHPDMLEYQLQFVSQGFEGSLESQTAAAQAFRDLCKYCSQHLISFLPQLHPFYLNTLKIIHKEDRYQLTEAISHILSCVPKDQLENALEVYCLPVAQQLHQKIQVTEDPQSTQLVEIRDLLDQLATFFKYVNPQVSVQEQHPCVQVMEKIWPVFMQLFKAFGREIAIAEATSRLFRNSMESYQLHFDPVLQSLLPLFVETFMDSGLPCYLWVFGHAARIYGPKSATQPLVRRCIEQLADRVFAVIQQSGDALVDQDEMIEEFYFILTQSLTKSPELLTEGLLDAATRCGIYALSSPSQMALAGVMDYFVQFITLASHADLQKKLLIAHGADLVKALFTGLVTNFPRDRQVVEDMADCLMGMSKVLGQMPLVECVRSVLSTWTHQMTAEQTSAFCTKLSGYMA
ncbi:armadillo-type protein [Gorgonomyces haynaldii]|nr:armadillo-type protein [Gorgonomyces haynaldii]